MSIPISKRRTVGQWAKLGLVIAVSWLVLDGLLVAFSWPNYPSSAHGWALLLIAGPPIYLFGEWLAGKFWSSDLGQGISDYPSSSGRIFLGVVTLLVIIGLGLVTIEIIVPWLLTTLKTYLRLTT